ncbi:MAG: hypothetical protein ABIQ16_27425 [Polyangiaceae bacterium]
MVNPEPIEQSLQLTARGYAVCELMLDRGLTLEAACEQVDFQLQTLRRTVERIMSDGLWEDVEAAMLAVLEGVSRHVKSAYLEEEQRLDRAGATLSA